MYCLVLASGGKLNTRCSIFLYCQLLGRPFELSSLLEEAKFFLYTASKTKERAAIPKPTQPKIKGMA